MDAFSQAYNALGLTLNARKTKVLFQPSPDNIHERHQPEITAGGQCLSSVDHFTYLGSCLSCKADLDAEIQARLHSASGAFGRLRTRVFDNRDIYINTKIKVYKAIILPTLLYGSEAWTTYSRHLKSLEKYHQRCLRRILNIKWQDRRTNSSVLEEANVTSIESIIIKNQLRWAGHIVRMPMSRLPKKILYGELSNGKRNQGGQRKRFKDNLKRNLKQCAINTEDWEEQASNRPGWRHAIHTGAAHSEQQRKEHSEKLRAERNARQQAVGTAPTSTEFRCPICLRTCLSRIGLHSHQRTHKRNDEY